MRLTIARILCGLLALFFVFSGLGYMFAPATLMESSMIEAAGDGIFGMANVRANIGAAMVTFGIMFAMGGVVAQQIPIRVTMIFLTLAIVARVTNLIVLGVDADNGSIRLLIIMVVMLGIAFFSHQSFGNRYAGD